MTAIVLSIVQCSMKVLESYLCNKLKSLENEQKVLVIG